MRFCPSDAAVRGEKGPATLCRGRGGGRTMRFPVAIGSPGPPQNQLASLSLRQTPPWWWGRRGRVGSARRENREEDGEVKGEVRDPNLRSVCSVSRMTLWACMSADGRQGGPPGRRGEAGVLSEGEAGLEVSASPFPHRCRFTNEEAGGWSWGVGLSRGPAGARCRAGTRPRWTEVFPTPALIRVGFAFPVDTVKMPFEYTGPSVCG